MISETYAPLKLETDRIPIMIKGQTA